jgi:hypothetical protein
VRRALVLLVLAVAASTVVLLAGSSSVSGADAPWLTTTSAPLFDLDGLIPGDAGDAALVVTNRRGDPGRFTMRIVDLTIDDNGCTRPEMAAGDDSCGLGQGELQEDLRVALVDVSVEPHRVVAEGSAAELAARGVADERMLAHGEQRPYELRYELPLASSNLTQTDRIGFAVEARLDPVHESGQRASLSEAGPLMRLLAAEVPDVRGQAPPGPVAALVAGVLVLGGLVLDRRRLR